MKYFFLIIDYSIPVLMIVSYPWWKKIADGNINNYSGFRTSVSMKNPKIWKKANLLCGKCCLKVGIFLFILVSLVKYFKPFPMEWNSLILAFINIVSMIPIIVYVNKKSVQED